MKSENKYMVFYFVGCCPQVKHFTTEKAALKFASNQEDWARKIDNTEDNWVDCIIKGHFVKHYPNSPY